MNSLAHSFHRHSVKCKLYCFTVHIKYIVNALVLHTYLITRPTHRRTDANLYPPERQLTKASEPSFDLEGGAKGQI